MLFVGALKIKHNALHALPSEGETPVANAMNNVSVAPDSKHQNMVSRIVFGPRDLVATLTRGEIKIWNSRSSQAIRTLSFPNESISYPDLRSGQLLAFSPTGSRIAVVVQSRLLEIYNVQSGEKLLTLGGELIQADEMRRKISQSIPGFGDNYARIISSVAFSADGTRLFSSGSYDEPPRVWDAKTGEMLHVLEAPRFFDATQITISPKSQNFAIFASRTLVVFDSATGLEKFRIQGDPSETSFDSYISAASFADGGKTLVTIGYAGVAKTYDCNTGKLLTSFRPMAKNYKGRHWIIFDQGKRLATMRGSDAEIRGFLHTLVETWDIQRQQKLSQLVFPADSQRLVQGTYSADLWDISGDGTQIVTSGNYDDWEKQSYVWRTTSDVVELQGSLPSDVRVEKIKIFLQSEEGKKTR